MQAQISSGQSVLPAQGLHLCQVNEVVHLPLYRLQASVPVQLREQILQLFRCRLLFLLFGRADCLGFFHLPGIVLRGR